MELDLVLAVVNKEVSNGSWDSIPDVSDDEWEILINSESELANKSGFLSLALLEVRSIHKVVKVVCK